MVVAWAARIAAQWLDVPALHALVGTATVALFGGGVTMTLLLGIALFEIRDALQDRRAERLEELAGQLSFDFVREEGPKPRRRRTKARSARTS